MDESSACALLALVLTSPSVLAQGFSGLPDRAHAISIVALDGALTKRSFESILSGQPQVALDTPQVSMSKAL